MIGQKMYRIETIRGTPEIQTAYRIGAPPGEEGDWVMMFSKDNHHLSMTKGTWILKRIHEQWWPTIAEAITPVMEAENQRHAKAIAEIKALVPPPDVP
jgi:hypothetical protein